MQLRNRLCFNPLAVLTALALLFAALTVPVGAATTPTPAWVAQYGGPLGKDNYATGIRADSAGNVYVTGHSHDSGAFSWSLATVKYSPEGRQLWEARTQADSIPRSPIAPVFDRDGNFYISNWSQNNEGPLAWLQTLAYDPNGRLLWGARYTAPNLWYAQTGVAVDSQHNVYVATTGDAGDPASGIKGMVMLLIKYSSQGTQLWAQTYGDPWQSRAVGAAVDSLDNVYVVGDVQGNAALLKYDGSGTLLWADRYDSPGFGTAVALDAAGNPYLGGVATGVGADFLVAKYDPSGKRLWADLYDGPAQGSSDALRSLTIDPTGGVIVTGDSTSLDPSSSDIATVKYDATGRRVWVARAVLGGYAQPTAAAADALGNVFVTGVYGASGEAQTAVIKYDPAGQMQWQYGTSELGVLGAFSGGLALDQTGNLYVATTPHYSTEPSGNPIYRYATLKFAGVAAAPRPSAPTDLQATAVSPSEIDLSWQNNSPEAVAIEVDRRSASGGFIQLVAIGPSSTAFADRGLVPNTTYTYQVRALTTASSSLPSNDASATTPPSNKPAAPSSLTATLASVNRIRLEWKDNSDVESGFIIERKPSGGDYAQIGAVEANATAYDDEGLAPGTYTYRVKATGMDGGSDYSNEASATISLPAPFLVLTFNSSSTGTVKGGSVSFKVAVTNPGPQAASQATLVISVPEVVSAYGRKNLSFSPQTHQLSWSGPLSAQGGSAYFSFKAKILGSARVPSDLALTAVVASSGFQGDSQTLKIRVSNDTVPQSVDVDASGGFGMLDGIATVDGGQETPPLKAVLSPVPSRPAWPISPRSFNMWLGVRSVSGPASPSALTSVGGVLAHFNLIAPGTSPTYDAQFDAVNQSVTMSIGMTDDACRLTLAEQILTASGVPVGPADLVGVLDDWRTVSGFSKAVRELRTPPKSLAGWTKALGHVANDLTVGLTEADKIAIKKIAKKLGKNLSNDALEKGLGRVGSIVKLTAIFGDMIYFVRNSGGNDMEIRFVASPLVDLPGSQHTQRASAATNTASSGPCTPPTGSDLYSIRRPRRIARGQQQWYDQWEIAANTIPDETRACALRVGRHRPLDCLCIGIPRRKHLGIPVGISIDGGQDRCG